MSYSFNAFDVMGGERGAAESYPHCNQVYSSRKAHAFREIVREVVYDVSHKDLKFALFS